MARMAWFKKERKPRTSERVKLEIPADAWEKCDECGHIDIKDRFVRALNVCPNCGHHRRISAQEYIDLLVDEGSWHELDAGLRSTDPLNFESYRDRLLVAVKKAGPLEALRSGYARLDGMPIDLAVMDFNFMGGSMGSVVGEKIARLTRRSAEKHVPLIIVSASGGARMRSEEHTSELQSRSDLVCRLLLEKKKQRWNTSEPLWRRKRTQRERRSRPRLAPRAAAQ